MLYFVTLKYIRPPADIEAHLDTHRAWLAKYAREGKLLVAGPLDDSTGGAVVACCETRAELDAMIDSDSFKVHNLVEYAVAPFKGAIRAAAFAQAWAPDAKAV